MVYLQAGPESPVTDCRRSFCSRGRGHWGATWLCRMASPGRHPPRLPGPVVPLACLLPDGPPAGPVRSAASAQPPRRGASSPGPTHKGSPVRRAFRAVSCPADSTPRPGGKGLDDSVLLLKAPFSTPFPAAFQHSGQPTKAPLWGIRPLGPGARNPTGSLSWLRLLSFHKRCEFSPLTKQTFKHAFFTSHFNSLCGLLCLHQHWGLCAEWQREMVASQTRSLKK